MRDFLGYLAPGTETGVKQNARPKHIKRRLVIREMIRLPSHRLFPCDTQPGEVFHDGGFEFRPATPLINILDAQQETPTGFTGRMPRLQS